MNELLAALDHAAERFKDLQPVELTAETREVIFSFGNQCNW